MILTNLRKNASTVNSYNEAWGNLRLKKHTHWSRCISGTHTALIVIVHTDVDASHVLCGTHTALIVKHFNEITGAKRCNSESLIHLNEINTESMRCGWMSRWHCIYL